MPIFKKTSFKATRKVPKRQPDAGSVNPAQLTNDKAALDPNLDFSQTPLKLNLGGQCMLFQNGEWVAQDDLSHSSVKGSGNESAILKERIASLEEENNMLRYKIELLLDMLAVSNCDLDCTEKELRMLKKNGKIVAKDSGFSVK